MFQGVISDLKFEMKPKKYQSSTREKSGLRPYSLFFCGASQKISKFTLRNLWSSLKKYGLAMIYQANMIYPISNLYS